METIDAKDLFKIADYCLLEYQKKQLIILLTQSMLNDDSKRP